MRKLLIAAALAASAALPGVAMAQYAYPANPYDWHQRHHYGERHHHGVRSGECAELRKACMHKGELGERGEGNCARYRQMCRP